MSETTRRGAIATMAVGAGTIGGAATLWANAGAAGTEPRPIPWTVPDNAFERWFFFKGDDLLLAPEIEPMRECGLYAVPVDDDFKLIFVTVGITTRGDVTDSAFRIDRPGEKTLRFCTTADKLYSSVAMTSSRNS